MTCKDCFEFADSSPTLWAEVCDNKSSVKGPWRPLNLEVTKSTMTNGTTSQRRSITQPHFKKGRCKKLQQFHKLK